MKFPRLHPAPFVGLAVMVSMLGLFNAQLIAAHTFIWTQPTAEEIRIEAPKPAEPAKKQPSVPKNPLVVMPKAGIKAPVVYGMASTAATDVQRALERGVLHFGGSALPGHAGNAVYVGHSSGQPWAPGNYKFVFTMLYKLNPGDRVQLAYKGELYVYRVTEKIVVDPIDVSVLEQTETATATFITCWPVGLNAQRMVIKSELINRQPKQSSKATPQGAPELQDSLPGGAYDAIEALQERF